MVTYLVSIPLFSYFSYHSILHKTCSQVSDALYGLFCTNCERCSKADTTALMGYATISFPTPISLLWMSNLFSSFSCTRGASLAKLSDAVKLTQELISTPLLPQKIDQFQGSKKTFFSAKRAGQAHSAVAKNADDSTPFLTLVVLCLHKK